MRWKWSCALAVVFAVAAACAHSRALTPSRIETFALKSSVFGNERTIRVYLPPGYDAHRGLFPVMFLNDGFAVFSPKAWNAPATIDSLIAARAIPALVVVGIDNGATAKGGSPLQRTREYVPYRDPQSDPDTADALGDRYPEFLVGEVLPAVEQRYRIRRDAAGRGIGGSSYGGVAALYATLERPGVFDRLLLESTPLFLSHEELLRQARGARVWPRRVYAGAGTAETDDETLRQQVVASPQRLASVIRSNSPRTIVEVRIEPGAAHNGKAWGGRLAGAMKFLWGRPAD